MSRKRPILLLIPTLLAVLTLLAGATGVPPVILNIMPTGSVIALQWQADPGNTQWVDRAEALSTNPAAWAPVFTNFPATQATNTWVDMAATNYASSFYRVRAQVEDVSPKIGQTATFVTRSHGVSGTAEILDADTIRVTNFNYDAAGLLVYMVVSPNQNFAPYTAISGDLVRDTAYVNETLDFTLPPETTLEDVNYISVWCVDVSVSFGDGPFQ